MENVNMENVKQERDYYKGLVERDIVEQAILQAATEQEALQPFQFVDFLASATRVVKETDSNGETRFAVLVKEGEDLMTPTDAIGKWKALPKNANLFQALKNANPPPASEKIDFRTITAEQYAEIRKTPEGRKRLGLPRQL